MQRMVVIITGLSGSGKSTAAKTLEDIGFFCVDNIPVDLLPKLLELTDAKGGEPSRLALGIDLRQAHFFSRFSEVLAEFAQRGVPLEIVFLEARDQALVRRYSETRRQHPLAQDANLLDGIRKERQALMGIREKADHVIDTSDMTVHQLRDEIRKLYEQLTGGGMKITVNSFGFGKGLPMESDLVLDVRFLPNPYFVESLRSKDGRDPAVREWLAAQETTKEFLTKLEQMLVFLLPLYIREGKQYLTISVGCTGGRHRSVVVAGHVAQILVRNGFTGVELHHRELGV